jgi:hypothetical protein
MAKKRGMARREFLTRATVTAAAATELTSAAEAGSDTPAEPDESPASNLDELERAVEGVLAGKRIGQPVFVRYTLPATGKARQTVARLVHMTQAVRRWIGQPLVRLYAVGSAEARTVSLTVQFRDGASALLSIVQGKGHGDGVDLFVVGNHGALHHDSASGPAWDGTAAPHKGQPDAKLTAVIERALRSGRPETVDTRRVTP